MFDNKKNKILIGQFLSVFTSPTTPSGAPSSVNTNNEFGDGNNLETMKTNENEENVLQKNPLIGKLLWELQSGMVMNWIISSDNLSAKRIYSILSCVKNILLGVVSESLAKKRKIIRNQLMPLVRDLINHKLGKLDIPFHFVDNSRKNQT